MDSNCWTVSCFWPTVVSLSPIHDNCSILRQKSFKFRRFVWMGSTVEHSQTHIETVYQTCLFELNDCSLHPRWQLKLCSGLSCVTRVCPWFVLRLLCWSQRWNVLLPYPYTQTFINTFDSLLVLAQHLSLNSFVYSRLYNVCELFSLPRFIEV